MIPEKKTARGVLALLAALALLALVLRLWPVLVLLMLGLFIYGLWSLVKRPEQAEPECQQPADEQSARPTLVSEQELITLAFGLLQRRISEEGIAVGEFLDRLGNKKSDFVVMATWEYLQHHPEVMAPDARIKIQTRPMLDKDQVLAEVKGMVAEYLEELLSTKPSAPMGRADTAEPPSLDEFGIEEMLDNLNVFDT